MLGDKFCVEYSPSKFFANWCVKMPVRPGPKPFWLHRETSLAKSERLTLTLGSGKTAGRLSDARHHLQTSMIVVSQRPTRMHGSRYARWYNVTVEVRAMLCVSVTMSRALVMILIIMWSSNVMNIDSLNGPTIGPIPEGMDQMAMTSSRSSPAFDYLSEKVQQLAEKRKIDRPPTLLIFLLRFSNDVFND